MPILIASLVLIAPLYVWRFSILGLPTNFLMLFNFVLIAILVYKITQESFTASSKITLHLWTTKVDKLLSIGICGFGVAGIISLLVGGVSLEKLGQWIVLYFQPIVLFCLIRVWLYLIPNNTMQRWQSLKQWFVLFSYCLVGFAGIIALIQYFTLVTLPVGWWGNANEPKRAIAFFAHPNAYALFVTPLLAWLIPDFVKKIQQKNELWLVVAWAVGLVGLMLSLSRGAWLGLLSSIVVFVLLSANKKVLLGFGVMLVLLAGVVFAVPNLRYRVLLPFHGEKSTVSRFSLWQTGEKMIQSSPVLGLGVSGFDTNWENFNTDPNLEHYNFPHNIVLNFWIDSGLLGLLSIMLVFVSSVIFGWVNKKNTIAFGLLLAMVAIAVHGLVDIPYFKNDLALIFWLLLGLSWFVTPQDNATASS